MTWLRLISLILLAVSALMLPVWFFAIAALIYAFTFSPYEPVVLGVLVDAQFGDGETWTRCTYTIAASVALLITVYLKPRLSLYS